MKSGKHIDGSSKGVKESSIFSNLNDVQKDACLQTEGYVRLVAGAGTGKTKALISRYLYLTQELGIHPGNILCITFTNKAANEIENRIKKFVGKEINGSFITTYHGFCARFLREEIYKLNYPKTFQILDIEDQKSILRQVFKELDIQHKDNTFNHMLPKIKAYKYSNDCVDIFGTNRGYRVKGSGQDQAIIQLYLEKQKAIYALDFDDLILFTLHILSNNKEIRQRWAEQFNYVMIDEYQDSNKVDNDLIDILSAHHKNLFVVGDPDQTIYEWRGANVDFINKFDINYPNVKTIIMAENYRSTKSILAGANDVIKNNNNRIEKDLFTKNKNGEKIIYYHGNHDSDQADRIAENINILCNKGVSHRDIAILFRGSSSSRKIEQACVKTNIAYTIYGGIRFFERKEIKDITSYLKLLENVNDDLAFKRIINYPPRLIGEKRLEYIEKIASTENTSLYYALMNHCNEKIFNGTLAVNFIDTIELLRKKKESIKVSDLLQQILELTGIIKIIREDGDEVRLENIEELMSSITKMEQESGEHITLSQYLQDIALYTNLDKSEIKESVKLMTIHQSKGLEFSHVFICDLIQGLLPNKRSFEDRENALEEERRLMYVAMTRAKEQLYLTNSGGYDYNGSQKFPSMFLYEIDKNLLDVKGEINTAFDKEGFFSSMENEFTADNLSLGIKGDKIHHYLFGDGQVVEVYPGSLCIQFNAHSTTKTMDIKTLEKLRIEGGFRKI